MNTSKRELGNQVRDTIAELFQIGYVLTSEDFRVFFEYFGLEGSNGYTMVTELRAGGFSERYDLPLVEETHNGLTLFRDARLSIDETNMKEAIERAKTHRRERYV